MEKYTHADISFDKFARIHIEPLILGSFKPTPAPSNSSTEDEAEGKEPAVVDVKVWYEMIGQKILQTQITELNSKGHSKLTVKENGDIVIKKQGKELLQTSLREESNFHITQFGKTFFTNFVIKVEPILLISFYLVVCMLKTKKEVK